MFAFTSTAFRFNKQQAQYSDISLPALNLSHWWRLLVRFIALWLHV